MPRHGVDGGVGVAVGGAPAETGVPVGQAGEGEGEGEQ